MKYLHECYLHKSTFTDLKLLEILLFMKYSI